MMRTLKSLLLGIAALGLLAFATAQHEEDIHLGYVDSVLAVIEPHELAEPPYTVESTLEELLPGVYGVDVGWDFYTPDGQTEPQLRRVTVQQVFISPGLYGVVEGETDPIFGHGLPGLWMLEYTGDPDSVHQHIIFASTTLPTRDNPLIFRFRLINGEALDGTPLQDSTITYTLQFVPEPAGVLVLGASLSIYALRRCLRRKPSPPKMKGGTA